MDEVRLIEAPLPDTRRTVSIITVMTDLLNQHGYEETEIESKDSFKLIDRHMHSLHLRNKNILSEIINDDMKRRIALTD